MKKLLSVILAVSLMMSLFCMVPASAENINTWPYFFEDFEDGESSVGSVSEITSVNGEGSAKSAKFIGESVGYESISINAFRGWLRTGDTIKFTADLKLEQAIENNGLGIFMHYNGVSGYADTVNTGFEKNGYVLLDGSYSSSTPLYAYFDNTSTQWQKVTYEGVYIGADVYVGEKINPSLRIYIGSEQYAYFDNIEFQIVKDTVMDSLPTTRVIYENDFSENMAGFTYNGTTAEGSGLSVVTPADDAEESVLQMVDTNTAGHVKLQLNVGESLKTDTTYLLMYKARVAEATRNQDVETPGAWATTQSSKHRWTFDNKILFETTGITCNNTWKTVCWVINISYDDKDIAEDGILDFRWWINYDGTGSDTATYQFDDFELIELSGIYDGNFDANTASPSSCDIFRGVTEECYNGTTNLQGIASPALNTAWTSTNGRINARQSSSYHSAPYMATMYFYAIDGTATHTKTAYLTAGQRYKFSGWLRPCAMNSAGTLEIGVNYTYTDETAANSVVLTTAVTSSSKSSVYKEYTAEFTAPANMATAELYVKHIDTVGEDQNIDRLSTSSANLAYYTDDWGFEKMPSANIPTVTASATTAAGGIVSVAKVFTAPAGVTDASVIKLTATKDGVKSYIGSTTGTAITVPESYWTGYTLAAEITPVASNGYIGKVVTIEVPAVPVVVGTTFTATAADGATLTSDAATSGTAIWVAYDVNGKMLDWSSAPMSVTAGGTQTVAVPSDFDATGAAEVKVMLWADMIKCVPLVDVVSY